MNNKVFWIKDDLVETNTMYIRKKNIPE